MKNPKVTVVIPTYNRPDLLPRALRSILDQTYQDFEIIVVDDGVDIRSDSVIADIADERIKYIQHDNSRGGGAARNTGIANAQGEFIAFLDDDDQWLPEKLEKQVKVLKESGENVSVAFCGVVAYDTEGVLLYKKISGESGVVKPFSQILHKCYIWTSAMMIRRSFTEQGFIFDENLKKNQEWDLQLRLSKISDFYAIDEALTRLNILDDDSHMGGLGNVPNMIDGFNTFIAKHINDYKKQKKSLALRYFRLAELYFLNDQFKEMRVSIYRAWNNRPLYATYLMHLIASLFGKKVYYYFKNRKNV